MRAHVALFFQIPNLGVAGSSPAGRANAMLRWIALQPGNSAASCEVTDGLACAGEAGFGGTGRDISGRDKGLEAMARGDRRRLKGIRRARWSKGIRAGRAT